MIFINTDPVGKQSNAGSHNGSYKYGKSKLQREPFENIFNWVGLRYLLFESRDWDTWLYNKKDSIYLEITPSYRWHHGIKQKKMRNLFLMMNL